VFFFVQRPSFSAKRDMRGRGVGEGDVKYKHRGGTCYKGFQTRMQRERYKRDKEMRGLRSPDSRNHLHCSLTQVVETTYRVFFFFLNKVDIGFKDYTDIRECW
jgi:hypothetical protein